MLKERQFVDAQEMAANNPATFEAPTQAELDGIKPHQHVKVCTGGERFWVLVTSVDGDNITGTVANDLVCPENDDLEFEDEISFTKRNVYNILD